MALLRPPAPLRVCAPTAPPPPYESLFKIDPVPHLAWARMLARVVRRRDPWRFLVASDEERELESVAYATLCAHALRYDDSKRRRGTPEELFRGWSKRNIVKECVRAAEKLYNRGVTQLPARQKSKEGEPADGSPQVAEKPAPPRCRTCTEVFAGISWDWWRTDGRGEDEVEEADEPVIMPAPEVVSFCPVRTNAYAFELPERSGQNARLAEIRKRA